MAGTRSVSGALPQRPRWSHLERRWRPTVSVTAVEIVGTSEFVGGAAHRRPLLTGPGPGCRRDPRAWDPDRLGPPPLGIGDGEVAEVAPPIGWRVGGGGLTDGLVAALGLDFGETGMSAAY
ncbi:MAG: hypothetical protein IPQ14_10725 [Candidatus Microthrix sp.]|uniref:hypothetical protein n=1 Tax=Candidatus Neomicrothrix sp. TaxID=2719034 RepID=UPI0025C45F1F|nr:hypothetical protein [Candidatus Microthrix sp.]MBL0204771.1 hypothetical protein [Candidatus Microthrix sp.]